MQAKLRGRTLIAVSETPQRCEIVPAGVSTVPQRDLGESRGGAKDSEREKARQG
jgi:hypothetical protein